MPIYFKCKNCDEEHPSSIQMDKESFEDPTNIIQDNSILTCAESLVDIW